MVGENAPSAADAKTGEIIINNYGNVALRGFLADPLDKRSEVRLDTSVEPPVLHLKNALTTTLFGYTNSDGKFVNFDYELSHATHIVSGTYTGPGCKLELT